MNPILLLLAIFAAIDQVASAIEDSGLENAETLAAQIRTQGTGANAMAGAGAIIASGGTDQAAVNAIVSTVAGAAAAFVGGVVISPFIPVIAAALGVSGAAATAVGVFATVASTYSIDKLGLA